LNPYGGEPTPPQQKTIKIEEIDSLQVIVDKEIHNGTFDKEVDAINEGIRLKQEDNNRQVLIVNLRSEIKAI
jgi:hypothetical protein